MKELYWKRKNLRDLLLNRPRLKNDIKTTYLNCVILSSTAIMLTIQEIMTISIPIKTSSIPCPSSVPTSHMQGTQCGCAPEVQIDERTISVLSAAWESRGKTARERGVGITQGLLAWPEEWRSGLGGSTLSVSFSMSYLFTSSFSEEKIAT